MIAPRLILCSVAALGVSAVMTQLALMRELLSAFSGNELVLGIILANWLLVTGLGAALGRTAGRIQNQGRILVLAQFLVALLPLIQVLAVRTLRNEVFIRGAEVGLAQTAVSTFALLSPYCLVSGYLLALASAMLGGRPTAVSIGKTSKGSQAAMNGARTFLSPATSVRGSGLDEGNRPAHSEPAPDRNVRPPTVGAGRGLRRFSAILTERPAPTAITAVGRVYVADSLGSIGGGVLFSFVLISLLDHFLLLCVPAFLNLLVGLFLAVRLARRSLAGIGIACCAGLGALVLWINPDAVSTAFQYPGQRVLFAGNSPYGRLVVTEHDGQVNFVENGLPLFSSHNLASIEETVHYAMAQRPGARQVLLVGGGVSGTATEILRYGVAELTYVELDPLIIELGRRFRPDALTNEQLRVVNTDGRLFVKHATRLCDVLIVDAPEPSTSQINRFYTAEFFQEAKRAMATNGVLCFALGRYENFVSPELARLLSSAHQTVRQSFTNVFLIPGGRVFFLASDGPLFSDIAARLEQAGITTQWVNRHYLDAMLSPDRLADLRRAVRQPAEPNTDFNPVLYFYHLLHWMSQFDTRFHWALGALGLGLAVYLVRLRAAAFAVFASGFAATALEIVLLFGFQVLQGSLYRQIGIVVTSFMAGLAAGAFIVNRRETASKPRRDLFLAALSIAALGVLLPLVLAGLGRWSVSPGSALVIQVVIPLVTFVLAVLVGLEFPLANRVEFKNAAATASALYTADFVGACLGALLASAWLIPMLGIANTCWITAGLNLCAALLVFVRKMKS
jgi:spermidine synthase